MKVSVWNDDQTKQEIRKRFTRASDSRRRLEDQWSRNEAAAFGTDTQLGGSLLVDSMGNSIGGGSAAGSDEGDEQSSSRLSVAYTFKNLRFIHSQLSANPPSVAMRPTSSDQQDQRRADAADRVVRFSIRRYQMQENFDQHTLNTLTYGLGAIKTIWDSSLGDIIEYDQESGEILTEGDINIQIPHTRNIFIDPDARQTKQIKWVVERIYMDYELACAKWPEKAEILKQAQVESQQGWGNSNSGEQQYHNCVTLLEYWEQGLASNAYLGRYCVTTDRFDIVEPCKPSPFRFARAGTIYKINASELPDEEKARRITKLPQMASLPYHFLTDIDVPNSVWGKSALEFAAPLQETLASIDTAYIDNLRAHAVARMVVSDQAEVDIDLSNSPWDITRVSANQAPFFMEVPQLMPELGTSRINMVQGINDTMGVNESMFGQQSREQSGQSMQYATNQGNMIRRRLFNKYVLCVESVYKSILNLVRKHWTIERTIHVLGEEKAFEAMDLKGSDIDGGYDVVGEYGVTLSLDPMTRREEIMALQPMFEKAGIPTRMSLKMMKLNELEGMYDKLQMAGDRQREVFDEMIATGKLIQPETQMDHENMIAWALDWFMTAEFKYLSDMDKDLCKEHNRLRIELAAKEKQPGGLSGQPQAPGPAGSPGQLPAAPGAVAGAEQMPVEQAPPMLA